MHHTVNRYEKMSTNVRCKFRLHLINFWWCIYWIWREFHPLFWLNWIYGWMNEAFYLHFVCNARIRLQKFYLTHERQISSVVPKNEIHKWWLGTLSNMLSSKIWDLSTAPQHSRVSSMSQSFGLLWQFLQCLYLTLLSVSVRFPVLSPLSQFRSLPRLCPHQSHLHTISGLSGLAPKHGYCCSRCAQRKWPPILIPPLDSLKDPLKPPQTLILPSLNTAADQQKSPLLGGVCVDTHHTQAVVPNAVQEKVEGSEVKEKRESKEGELTVLSVGRWDMCMFSSCVFTEAHVIWHT